MTEQDLGVQELHYSWPGGPELFSGLDLRLAAGRITAIVGESGCGKSTLLRLLAQLLSPTQGTVTEPAASKAFVFQSPNLLPWRSVGENVGLPLELTGTPDPQRIDAALRAVELADSRDQLPHTLSGGMQMRTALARALVTTPTVLFMDEPFSSLDALTRTRLQQEFLALWREHGFTVLLVTHDIESAVRLSDRVLVLGNRPVSVQADLAIELPRPRDLDLRHDPRTGAYIRQIEDAL